jgi:ATP-binding cassette subfamily B protein
MQESTLFSGTVRDNLLFGREEASEEEIAQAVRDAQAFEFIDALPEGLMSPVEQRGKNLSGGQKQRLSIARTLLANPGVLILDDSTSAVDLATESRLHGAIGERMAGSTVIVIAQRISAVMHADRILVLDNGRVSALGTHEELLRSSEVYRSIVVSQLGEEALAHAAC